MILSDTEIKEFSEIEKRFLEFMENYQSVTTMENNFFHAINDRFSLKKTVFFVKLLDSYVNEVMKNDRVNMATVEVPTLKGNIGDHLTATYCMLHVVTQEVNTFNIAVKDIFNNFEILRKDLRKKFTEEEINEIEEVAQMILNGEIQDYEPRNAAANGAP